MRVFIFIICVICISINTLSSQTTGHVSHLKKITCETCTRSLGENCLEVYNNRLNLDLTITLSSMRIPNDIYLRGYYGDNSVTLGITTIDTSDPIEINQNGCIYFQYKVNIGLAFDNICDDSMNSEVIQLTFSLEYLKNNILVPLTDGFPFVFENDCFGQGISSISHKEQIQLNICCMADEDTENLKTINRTFTNTQKIYPNPSSTVIYLEGFAGKIASLKNHYGKEIERLIIKDNTYDYNISHLPNGFYYLCYNNQLKMKTSKIIKI